MSAISNFLYNVLSAINNIVGNYGVAIIVFTVLMRLVCLPFDYRSRKGMQKMTEMQPKLDALKRRYGNDQQKFQQKQAELMRKEHYNPLSGCLPLLLTWPLMIAMFTAMRNIANEKLAEQVFLSLLGEENFLTAADRFLWIKSVWITDSPFAPILPTAETLQFVPMDIWQKAFHALQPAQLEAILQNMNGVTLDFATQEAVNTSVNAMMAVLGQLPSYQAAIATVPGWTGVNFLLFSVTLYQNYNGLLIMPVLAGVTQILQTKLNPQSQNQQMGPTGQNTNTMGNFMKWFFPILSIWFCLTSNAGFAIYWVTSNVVIGVQTILINKHFEKKSEKEKNSVSGEGSVK